MNAEPTWEIPPLDHAPDITRPEVDRPGQVLADPRNWPGIGVAVAGLVFVVVAAALATAGYSALALTAVILGAVAVIGGALLYRAERRRAAGDGSTEVGPSRIGL